jgi:hypothetical protein
MRTDMVTLKFKEYTHSSQPYTTTMQEIEIEIQNHLTDSEPQQCSYELPRHTHVSVSSKQLTYT